MIAWTVTPRRFLVAALLVSLLQTAVLAAMIAARASVLKNGIEVVLLAAPVDPRDLLRGDYVILSYDISNIPSESISGPRPEEGGQARLSVRLKPNQDGLWGLAEASFEPLPPAEGTAVVVTEPLTIGDWMWSQAQTIPVTYGIEAFYVPEGEGRPIEAARNDGRITVAVRVSSAGQAQIRALMLDGEPLYEEPIY